MDARQLRDEVARPWARLWIARGRDAARSEEDALGYLVAWHVADELHVLNVATRPDWQRRGVGRALMGSAIAYAREHRAKHVLLEVRRSNRAAIALYRAVGFFAMGVRSRYYPDDEDAVEMVLMFDAETGDIVPHEDEVRLDV
jgi:ribosomal-protein-alanine N-acetyltransferase